MQCTQCRNVINNPKPHQKFCISCKYDQARLSKKKVKQKEEKEGKQYSRVCRACKKQFTSSYKVEKFCSPDCRNLMPTQVVNKNWLCERKRSKLQKEKIKSNFNAFRVYPETGNIKIP